MRVQPAPGIKIRCPETKELLSDSDAITVPVNSKFYHFWRRRVRDKDAIVVTIDVRNTL